MFDYYTAIIFLNIFSTLILLFCVGKSNTLSSERRMLFRLLFAAIIISAFCEWLGVLLQGADPSYRTLHILAKAIEFSVAPCIAFIFSWVIEKRLVKPVFIYLLVNCILECASGVFGFIYYVDQNNIYHHANFYWIYITIYLLSILFGIIIVMRNIKKYQYNGTHFFIMTVVLMLSGISIQLADSNLKVDYITLGMASAMLYVFTLEMIQQTDELTGLLNRRGYENTIENISKPCIVIFFDVDNFKNVNDTFGHTFGDYSLTKIGDTIKKHYSRDGKCFRYGGDEFCVILLNNIDNINNINKDFCHSINELQEKESNLPGVSIGYAHYDPEKQSIQDSLEEADRMMYQVKAQRKST